MRRTAIRAIRATRGGMPVEPTSMSAWRIPAAALAPPCSRAGPLPGAPSSWPVPGLVKTARRTLSSSGDLVEPRRTSTGPIPKGNRIGDADGSGGQRRPSNRQPAQPERAARGGVPCSGPAAGGESGTGAGAEGVNGGRPHQQALGVEGWEAEAADYLGRYTTGQ